MKWKELNFNINKVGIIVIGVVCVVGISTWYIKTHKNMGNSAEQSIPLYEKYSSEEEALEGELSGTIYDLGTILYMAQTEEVRDKVPMSEYNGKQQREFEKLQAQEKSNTSSKKEDTTDTHGHEAENVDESVLANELAKAKALQEFIDLTGTSLEDYDKLTVAYDGGDYIVFIAQPSSEDSKYSIKNKCTINIPDMQLAEHEGNIVGVKAVNSEELVTNILDGFKSIDELLKSAVVDGYNKQNQDIDTEGSTEQEIIDSIQQDLDTEEVPQDVEETVAEEPVEEELVEEPVDIEVEDNSTEIQ